MLLSLRKPFKMIGKIVRTLLIIFLTGVIAVSLYNIWKINEVYRAEADAHKEVIKFKPTLPPSPLSDEPVVNKEVLDLKKQNPDVIGWLTVPSTQIDYPFVQSKDNDFYLHRDINKDYLEAGTLFLDFRNKPDFSDFHTIIYGHHMKNGSMFGDLREFKDEQFFNSNKEGFIFLEDKNYTIKFFAFLILSSTNDIVYGHLPSAKDEKTNFLSYIKNNAQYYRSIGVTETSQLVTLSTCSYEFDEARMVLIGVIS